MVYLSSLKLYTTCPPPVCEVGVISRCIEELETQKGLIIYPNYAKFWWDSYLKMGVIKCRTQDLDHDTQVILTGKFQSFGDLKKKKSTWEFGSRLGKSLEWDKITQMLP